MSKKIETQEKTLFNEVKENGIPYGSHYSDLHIPKNAQTTALLKKYNRDGAMLETFFNDDDKRIWYSVFMEYTPYWERKFNSKRANAEYK